MGCLVSVTCGDCSFPFSSSIVNVLALNARSGEGRKRSGRRANVPTIPIVPKVRATDEPEA